MRGVFLKFTKPISAFADFWSGRKAVEKNAERDLEGVFGGG